jgi:hypothetical protein
MFEGLLWEALLLLLDFKLRFRETLSNLIPQFESLLHASQQQQTTSASQHG